MKKIYLSLLGLTFAAYGFAQTTIDDPLTLKEGDNKFINEQSTAATDVYWEYTSSTDQIIVAEPINSSCLTCWEIVDDEMVPILGGQYTYNDGTKWHVDNVYPVPAGKTVYVRANGSQTIGLNADIRESYNVLGGVDQNHWGEIKPGTMQYFGNDRNNIKNPIYAKVTPAADGVLKFTTNSPVGYAVDENGVQYQFDKSDETYASTAVVKVKGGRENKLLIYSYGAMVFSTEFLQPEAGAYENPFDLAAGSNTLPAAAGTYWYVVAADRDCMLNITGDATLGGGQVSVYNSTYNVVYNRPVNTSLAGTLAVSYPVTAGTTYYVKVDKKASTAADETFTFGLDDYKDGDVESHPIAISEFPGKYTVPSGKTVYYSVSVAPGETKMLTVDAIGALGAPGSEAESATLTDNDTHVSVYQPTFTEVKNCSYVRTKLYGGTEGATYTVRWVSKDAHDFNFKVYLDPLADGDDVSQPITAAEGDNTFTAAGTQFYVHHATKSGKLMVTVPQGVTLVFPKTDLLYQGCLDASLKGNVYAIDVKEGDDYRMEFIDCQQGAKFNVAYGEWATGEVYYKPIEVAANGSYTLTANDYGQVWLKCAATTGESILTIDATQIPTDGNAVNYCLGDDIESLYSMYASTDDGAGKFFTVVSFSNVGDYYLVQLKLAKPYAGSVISFSEREAAEGESVNKALTLQPGEPFDLGFATETKPLWLKVMFYPGEVNFACNGWIKASIFNSKEDAQLGHNAADLLLLQTEGKEQGSTNMKFERDLEVTEGADGEHYIRITASYGSQLTVTGEGVTPTGISTVGGSQPAKVEACYTLDGTKVQRLQKGVNIVRLSDGRTVKVMGK